MTNFATGQKIHAAFVNNELLGASSGCGLPACPSEGWLSVSVGKLTTTTTTTTTMAKFGLRWRLTTSRNRS
ncbi:arachidonate 5-lipoxygenase [Anopheles sinensis]|uniref:Arachidonate 5-lipoxygenase n=1 Tax=Anopheles sinensis TaxID=74873 RepID=A0A084WDT9_ANOSI|nr:arachidonate 5-lipoxygenase [Anopheles sinensis]